MLNWAIVNPWKVFRKWLNKSRFVAFVVGAVIFGTFTFCFLTIKYEYKEIFDSRTIVIINTSRALASTARENADVSQAKVEDFGVSPHEVGAPSIEQMIEATFPEDPETMLAIAKAESRLKPEATNINRDGSKDCGIFQINSIHGYDCEWLKVPENNMKAARAVYEKQGLTAWATYNYAIEHNRPI